MMHPNVRRLLFPIAVLAAALSPWALSINASAQNALGSGGALDANIGVGTGRINAPARVDDFRARNLLVTGNVVGGRGFRGSVGYAAETDFRGATGVDDFFRFQADAAFSAPQFATSPGWQQMRFGRDLGEMSLRRGGGVTSSGLITGRPQPTRFDEFRTDRPFDDRLRIDAIIAGAGTTGRIEAPPPARPVGVGVGQEGRLLMIEASPIRGLTAVTPEERAAQLGLSPYDLARLRAEEEAQPQARFGVPYETGFRGLTDPGRLQTGIPDARLRMGERDQMADVLERIARRYAGRTDTVVHVDPQLLRDLDDEYRDLRDRLTHLSPLEQGRIRQERAAGERPGIGDPLTDPAREDPARPVLPERAPGIDIDDDEPAARRPMRVEALPPGELERLFDALRHGQRIEQLAPGGTSRFDELMLEGEESLRAGEYFDAERRFMRALRIVPGHPLAMVGASHAQLGAGLQLPAALSIRRVLTSHPELIDARYGSELLPSRPRLIQAVDAIDVRLEGGARELSEYGLLLAYIGHQMEDRPLVERGLAVMEQAARDDSLLAVLRAVWLRTDEQDRENDRPETPEK